jgi:hypothetical protein
MADSPKAEKEKVEEETNLDASPAAEPKDSEEVLEPVAESTEEAPEEKKETGEKPEKKKSKKGFEKRVRQLVDEKKQAQAKAKSLEERLAELTAPVGPQAARQQPPMPQEQPIVTPGEEIDANELDRRIRAREQRILQQAEAVAELKTRQSEAISRINSEASDAIKANPELDPDSDSFNKELSDSITEATEAYVRANPYSASVKTFVAKLMKPYKEAVKKEVGEVTEKVAKQASETALRPTSVKGGEKKIEDMTLEEIEEKYGIVH